MSFVGAENRWIWTLLHMKILGKGGQTFPPHPLSGVRKMQSTLKATLLDTKKVVVWGRRSLKRKIVTINQNRMNRLTSSTWSISLKKGNVQSPFTKLLNVSVFIFILKTCTKDSFSNQIIFFYEIQILVSRLLSSLFYKLYSRGDHS